VRLGKPYITSLTLLLHRCDDRLARVTRMAQLGPAYITITHSGSLSEFLRNVDIAAKLQSAVAGVRTMLHMACVHMTPEHVATGLAAAKERGICNILATRGEGTLDGGGCARCACANAGVCS